MHTTRWIFINIRWKFGVSGKHNLWSVHTMYMIRRKEKLKICTAILRHFQFCNSNYNAKHAKYLIQFSANLWNWWQGNGVAYRPWGVNLKALPTERDKDQVLCVLCNMLLSRYWLEFCVLPLGRAENWNVPASHHGRGSKLFLLSCKHKKKARNVQIAQAFESEVLI